MKDQVRLFDDRRPGEIIATWSPETGESVYLDAVWAMDAFTPEEARIYEWRSLRPAFALYPIRHPLEWIAYRIAILRQRKRDKLAFNQKNQDNINEPRGTP